MFLVHFPIISIKLVEYMMHQKLNIAKSFSFVSLHNNLFTLK